MSIPVDKNPPEDTVIHITPGGEANSEEKSGELRSRTPYMDLLAPSMLGDEAKSTLASNKQKMKLAQDLIAKAVRVIQGADAESPAEKAQKIHDAKEAEKAKKNAGKQPVQVPESSVEQAKEIANSVKTMAKDFKVFASNYNGFFKIGLKALDLIAAEKHIMHVGDVERLEALAQYTANIKKALDRVTTTAYSSDTSGYKLAKQLESGTTAEGAFAPIVVEAWPWDNPGKKAEKLEKREQTEAPRESTQVAWKDSLLGPKKYPEEYKKAITLAGGLKTRLEGLQNQFERFQTYYNGFLSQVGNTSSKIANKKLTINDNNKDILTNVFEIVEAIKGDMDGVKKTVFTNPQKNAMVLTKNLLDKDRWKYENAFKTEPTEDVDIAPQHAKEAVTPQEQVAPVQPPTVPTAVDDTDDDLDKEKTDIKKRAEEQEKEIEERRKVEAPKAPASKQHTPEEFDQLQKRVKELEKQLAEKKAAQPTVSPTPRKVAPSEIGPSPGSRFIPPPAKEVTKPAAKPRQRKSKPKAAQPKAAQPAQPPPKQGSLFQ